MKITFCVPGISRKPVGGEKVIYEFANRLSSNGNEVTIAAMSRDIFKKTKLPLMVRLAIYRIAIRIKLIPSWFNLSNKVKVDVISSYEAENFKNSDFIVATAVDTALPVYKLPNEKGEKIYLIQDYENWNYSNLYVNKTYSLGMKNIVISRWLQKTVQNYDHNKTYFIPNAIDTNMFYPIIPTSQRSKHTIGLLYHKGKFKGLKYAFDALNIVHQKYPDLVVMMFGAPKRPNVPKWYEYYSNISSKEVNLLYNKCSIFLCASIKEGFGLTGAESMAAGCALVSTKYKGVFEYAEDNYNALLTDIKDSKGLAENIMRLFEDDKKRISITNNGVKSIQDRTWDRTIKEFEKILLSK